MSDLNKLISPGKWFAEFDEFGKCVRAEYSDSYRMMLGYETAEEYGQAMAKWESRVHPEDSERVEAHSREILAVHPEGMDYDIEYRMMTRRGYRWFHDYGHCTRREDGSLLRCDGVVFDIQDIMDFNEQRMELVRNNQRVMALEDNFESLYEVDLRTGRYFAYVKGEFYQQNVIDKLLEPGDYFEDLQENIDAVIYPEDRNALFSVLNRQALRVALSESERFEHYYRIVVNGSPVWFKIRVVYKDSEKNSVVIGVFNADDEVRQRQAEENKRAALIEHMAGDDGVFVVDIFNDTRSIIHDRVYKFAEFGGGTVYSETARQYIEKYVVPGDKEMMFVKMSLDYMQERFKRDNEYSVRFRDIANGYPKYFEMRVVKISDTEVLQSFRDCDDDVISSRLSSRLLSEYVSIYVVNLDDFSWKFYKRPTDLELFYPTSEDYLTSFGRYIEEEVHPDDRPSLSLLLNPDKLKRRLKAEPAFSIVFRKISEQTEKSFRLEILRNADNTVVAFAFKDVTKEVEEKESQKRQLEAALSMARMASSAKTSFLFNMSHDIRTPMNAILGYTSMIQKHIDDKERTLDYLDKISTAGNNLLGLVNQVLDMSRIESGKVILSEEPADVIVRAYEMTEIIGHAATSKNIQIITNIHNVRHPKVFADTGRMNQLILNILGNAVKYTPEGGRITYTVSEKESLRQGYSIFEFSTEDNGIGMSPEYIKTIYEPFSRENTSTVSKIQGTGLGMSIVKRLVDLMDGEIRIESQQGKGTKITIEIPMRLQVENIDDTKSRIEGTDFHVLKGRRVLLVEDNEMNLEITSMLLQEQGIKVETADDGDVAVRMIQDVADREDWGYYDYILMDIQMPRMNGYEATRAIRAIPTPPDVHFIIIAMTANAFEEDRQNALRTGMDDFVTKPIDVQNLWETLARFV